MPFVIDPPKAPPLPPPADDGSFIWEEMYEAMGFHAVIDAGIEGSPLRVFCEAWCKPLQAVYDIVRDRGDRPGWAILLDPDECPAESLNYPAQFVGVIPQAAWSEAQLRAEIKEPTTWRRGQTETWRTAIKATLTGTQRVVIRERTPDAVSVYVRTLSSETPSEARTRDVVFRNKVAGLLCDYETFDGYTLADEEANFESLDEEEATFASLDAILEADLPE